MKASTPLSVTAFLICVVCATCAAAFTVAPLRRAAAAELAVKTTVSEPAGIERRTEPATGGIPFHPGEVASVEELALFTADGKAVPAQFSKLAGYEDGSVQWALVDLLADVPAGGKIELVVKRGKTAAPARPLSIDETDAEIVVDAGAAKFTVNKADFHLLESVEIGGRRIAGPGSLDIVSFEGQAFRAGKPTRISWEYQGPIRATLRVDGEYLGEGRTQFISYTTRLSFWAGLAAVRVDQSVRNSDPKEGNDVKIKSASVSLGYKGEQQAGGPGWAAAAGERSTLLISQRHTGGCFPTTRPEFDKAEVSAGRATSWVVPEGKGGRHVYGYGDGFFALADCAHKDSQIWFDFRTDAAAAEKRRKAYMSWLHVLADPRQISDTGCLGFGKFGTLEDEIATYRKWGWSGIDDPRKRESTIRPHKPDCSLGQLPVHSVTESDSAELGLLMYVRTGQRGFLDEGEAYARYFKSHYTFRSDGFEYDGWDHGHVSKKVSINSKRKNNGAIFDWYVPRDYEWAQTRWCPCHFWGAGVFDYYCLTGDVDALEAGIDCAEQAVMLNSATKPGAPLSPSRAWGRNFMSVLRAYQVTRDEKWKKAADRFADMVKQAPNLDESGLFRVGMHPLMVGDYIASFFGKSKEPAPVACRQYIEEHGITQKYKDEHLYLTNKEGKTWEVWTSPQSFELAASVDAIARYAEVMHDKEMAAVTLKLAEGTLKHYWSKTCQQHTPYFHNPHIGMPIEGQVYDEADWTDLHANCATGKGAKHNGYHTMFLAEIFAMAYTNSGDPKWLEMARKAWSRGSKRGFWTSEQSTPDDTPASFASHSPPQGDGIDIRSCYRLFYEVPRAGVRPQD